MKLLLVLPLLFISSGLHAFTLNNSIMLKFSKDEVKVNVADVSCQNIGIDQRELLSLVSIAVDRFWNTVPTSRLKLKAGNLVNTSAQFYTEPICNSGTNCTPNPNIQVSNDILISCNNNTSNFASNGILGVTVPNNTSGSKIIGSLVLINDRNGSAFATKSIDEKVSIIAHELGHAFGLGHSPVSDSLMYYATMSTRVKLGQDDMDGISYLYPKEQPFAGCGTVDFNSTNKPHWWGGLFVGFALITLIDLVSRKRKIKHYT